MNWLGFATVALGFVAFTAGRVLSNRELARKPHRFLFWCAVLLAIPAALYAAYYFKILGEPIWLYRLRAITGSELLASPAGFLAGWAQVQLVPRLRLSALGKRFLVPVLLSVGLALPYLKPLLRPLR